MSRLPVILPVACYIILVLLGATTSSIGIGGLREDPDQPTGVQIGQSQGYRSDEFGTESPIWLGQMARGGAEDATPLSVSNDYFAQLPAGPVSGIVFFDGTLLAVGQWFPDEMLFAAKWWLPSLLLFLGLSLWFRQVMGSLRWGYLAAVLVFVAPATMWWSGRPVNTLGFVAAGCALTLYGYSRLRARSWVSAALALVGAGILLARLPSYYQPLAIIVGLPLVVATACFIVWSPDTWRTRLTGLTAIAVSGAVWTGLTILENRDAFVAGLSTVYPGDRASTGSPVEPAMLFGATSLGWLEPLSVEINVVQPELVTAFTVLLFVLAILAVARRWDGDRPQSAALIPIVALACFWLLWSTIDWGSLGAALPLVNRVPNTRAAQGLGYVAIIAFCLFMSRWRRVERISVPLISAAVAGLLTGYAGSWMQITRLPNMTTWMIWVSAVATALVVFALIRWPHRQWSLVLAGIAATAVTFTAPPILFGLGDLRASDTAQKFLEWGSVARTDEQVWASDTHDVDALMMATGTPSLSARQQIGPDRDAWLRLDPGGEHEYMWNRGGLHIEFDWSDDDELTFSQPSPDAVIMTGSPCAVVERIPELSHVASKTPLTGSCLTRVDGFDWGGDPYTVYAVADNR